MACSTGLSGTPSAGRLHRPPALGSRVTLSRFAPELRFDPDHRRRRRRRSQARPGGMLQYRRTGAHESQALVRRRHRRRRPQRQSRGSAIHRHRRTVERRRDELVALLNAEGARPCWTTSINWRTALPAMRTATIQRNTKETHISGKLKIEGRGTLQDLHRHPLLRSHAGAVHQTRRLRLANQGRRRPRRRSASHGGRRRASCSANCSRRRWAIAKASIAPAISCMPMDRFANARG